MGFLLDFEGTCATYKVSQNITDMLHICMDLQLVCIGCGLQHYFNEGEELEEIVCVYIGRTQAKLASSPGSSPCMIFRIKGLLCYISSVQF